MAVSRFGWTVSSAVVVVSRSGCTVLCSSCSIVRVVLEVSAITSNFVSTALLLFEGVEVVYHHIAPLDATTSKRNSIGIA